MSASIDYLYENGLLAKVSGNRLVVSPASKITPIIRQYIKAHRLELIAEVSANDGLARSSHWRVVVPGYRPFTMISAPITRAEALAAAQSKWPKAEIQ